MEWPAHLPIVGGGGVTSRVSMSIIIIIIITKTNYLCIFSL